MVLAYNKKIFFIALVTIIVFISGYMLSSGLFVDFFNHVIEDTVLKIELRVLQHFCSFEKEAYHYLLLPASGYAEVIYAKQLSFSTFFTLFSNTLFNTLLQPAFFCIFTPQVVLKCMLFPFFVYGSIKYFRKSFFMLVVFFGISFYIGLRTSIVEVLVRHGMICDLIYLLIGLAGFTDWMQESLS